MGSTKILSVSNFIQLQLLTRSTKVQTHLCGQLSVYPCYPSVIHELGYDRIDIKIR